jgi:hypothetical protein
MAGVSLFRIDEVVECVHHPRWTRGASDGGLATFDCESLDDALELAARVASGRAA